MARRRVRGATALFTGLLAATLVASGSALAAPQPLNRGTYAHDYVKTALAGSPNQTRASTRLSLYKLTKSSGLAHITNRARARATCDGCRSVAVSIQIVLVTTADTNPMNDSSAINLDCVGCESLAVARQIVLVMEGTGTFKAAARDRLRGLANRLQNLDYAGLPLGDLEAEINLIADNMARTVLSGFVGTNDDTIPTELCGMGEAPTTDEELAVFPSDCTGPPTFKGVTVNSLAPASTVELRGANTARSWQSGTIQADTNALARQLVVTHGDLRLRTSLTPSSFRNEANSSTTGVGKAPSIVGADGLDFESAAANIEGCVAAPSTCTRPDNVDSQIRTHAGQWLFGSVPTSFGTNEANSLLVGDTPVVPPDVVAASDPSAAGARLRAFRDMLRAEPDRFNADNDGRSNTHFGSPRSLDLGSSSASNASAPSLDPDASAHSIALQYTAAPSGTGCQEVGAERIPVPDVVTFDFPSSILACASANTDAMLAFNIATNHYVNQVTAQSGRNLGAPDPLSEDTAALFSNTANTDGAFVLQVNSGGGELVDCQADACTEVSAAGDRRVVSRTAPGEEVPPPAGFEHLLRNVQLTQETRSIAFQTVGARNDAELKTLQLSLYRPVSSPPSEFNGNNSSQTISHEQFETLNTQQSSSQEYNLVSYDP